MIENVIHSKGIENGGLLKCPRCNGTGETMESVCVTGAMYEICKLCYGTGKQGCIKSTAEWNVLVAHNHPIKGCFTIADVTGTDIDSAPDIILVSPLRQSTEVTRHIRILSRAHTLLKAIEFIYAGLEVPPEALRDLIEDVYGEDISKIMADSQKTNKEE